MSNSCCLTASAQSVSDAKTHLGCSLRCWRGFACFCDHRRCLACAARLEGPGEVDQSDSVSYYPEDREAGFVLLCTGKPRTSLRVRTHQAHEMREHRRQKNLP